MNCRSHCQIPRSYDLPGLDTLSDTLSLSSVAGKLVVSSDLVRMGFMLTFGLDPFDGRSGASIAWKLLLLSLAVVDDSSTIAASGFAGTDKRMCVLLE